MENERLYNESIILIGPSGAGKSIISKQLEQITKMRQICLDTIANQGRSSGLIKNFKSVDEYNAFLIKDLLKRAKGNEKPRIVNFGAGQSVYDDLDVFNDIKKMLSRFLIKHSLIIRGILKLFYYYHQ